MPDPELAAPPPASATAPHLQAVSALLAAERARGGATPTDRTWRFLLALYEAALSGRALTPAEAAEAAAVPPDLAPAIADNLASQAFLTHDEAGTLGLTEEAGDHLAIWVDALTRAPPVTPSRATEAAPRPEPPPGPPG